MSSSRTEHDLVEVTMPQMGVSVAEGTIVELAQAPRRLGRGRRDGLRHHDRQDRHRDPLAGQRPAGARSWSRRTRRSRSARCWRQIDTGAQPGQPHAAESQRRCGRPETSGSPDRSHVISPVVRRIADEHGIDLSQVHGHGIGGRIRKKDVLAFIDEPEPHAGAPAPHGVAIPAGARRRRRTASGASRSRRCAARSPSTWCAAGAPRRT